MKKRALILAVLLVFSVVLVACNNGVEEDDTTGKKNPPVVEDPTNDTNDTTGGNTEPEDPTYTFTELETPITVFAIKDINLRETPSFAASVAKMSVPTGTELVKIAESNESAIDSNDVEYKWFKVTYDNKEWYVKSTLVTAVTNPDEGFVEVTKTLYAKGSLKVRLVPTTENEAVGYINKGDEIKVIAENTEAGWYKIEFEGKYTPKGEYYITNDAKYFSETPITDAQ